MGNQLLKKVIGEQREKITKLEAKIDVANKILEPKIDAQQHLINSGSNMAVYALYFSKQELIDLKASLSQEQKPKEIDDEGWDHTNEPKWSTVANGEKKP